MSSAEIEMPAAALKMSAAELQMPTAALHGNPKIGDAALANRDSSLDETSRTACRHRESLTIFWLDGGGGAMSSTGTYEKEVRYLQKVACNLRAGCEELLAHSERLCGAQRERLLKFVRQLESCRQRVLTLADIAALGAGPNTPKESALDPAELHRRIRHVLKDLVATADGLYELAGPPAVASHWVN